MAKVTQVLMATICCFFLLRISRVCKSSCTHAHYFIADGAIFGYERARERVDNVTGSRLHTKKRYAFVVVFVLAMQFT